MSVMQATPGGIDTKNLRIAKADKPIDRVKCVVSTCTYWQQDDHCLASAIEIQPPNAGNTETTDCATFAPRPT